MIASLVRMLLPAFLLVITIAGPARAEEVMAKVTAAPVASVTSDGSLPSLLNVGGRILLVERNTAHLLSTDRQRWSPIDRAWLPAGAQIAASAADGTRSFVLFGLDGRATKTAAIGVEGNALRGRMMNDLPVPLQNARAALHADALIVAGRAPDGRMRLFRAPLEGSAWLDQPVWPTGVGAAALVGQGVGLFAILEDGSHWRWTEKEGWRAREAAPGEIVPGSGRAISQAGLLYLAVKDGGSSLYSYSAITNAWADLGHRQPAGALASVRSGNGLLSMWQGGGQLRFSILELQNQRRPLSLADWAVIIGFLALMLGMGAYFYQRGANASTGDFFLGSRSIPFWAAGISMFSSNTSSISYLAIPAKAFETDWQYMMSKIVTVGGLILVAVWVIPLFRRLNLVSVFNYLEMRFHPVIRMLSSALAIMMHVGGRMGVVLFLPALAIGTITGTNVIVCILLIGICTLIYTAIGGMRAVVWTDFFQILVLMGGAFFAIGFIIYSVGAGPIFESAMQYDKTKLLNVSFDFTQPTIWGFLILILFDTVLTFPKDQVLMQRALSTPSEKQASRSVWVFAAILLPGGFIFYFIGTMLFAYYQANPGRLDPLLPIDAVFPAFIGSELPPGLAGLIIAGLFAAAMGTVSGTINSVATLLSVDFYEKISGNRDQKKSLRFAEWMTVLVGLIGIGIAIILSRLDVHSLLDLTIELFGLLGGSCAGAYTLGMFTRRSNWQGVAIGIVSASLITLACWIFGLVHPYFYLAIAIVMSIVVGYIASLFFPPPPAECLAGLTVYDGGGRKGRSGELAPSISTS